MAFLCSLKKYLTMEQGICLYRKARDWSDTTVVSIPAESVRQLDINEGETLKIQIQKTEGEAESTA